MTNCMQMQCKPHGLENGVNAVPVLQLAVGGFLTELTLTERNFQVAR